MHENKVIPNLFRAEYRRLVSVLYNRFGFDHLAVAEDIASDTFLTAAETWGIKGVPDNPAGWLHTVARNKALDIIKRQRVYEQKIIPGLSRFSVDTYTEEIDFSEQNILDSQLKMMFAICHPAIPVQAQIGLSLRILCGFGIEEIAEAFMISKEAISKRLQRARDRLRQQKIKIELPVRADIEQRMQPVLATLYLLFNEGYYSSNKNSIIRRELCVEAMRLTLMLIDFPATNISQVSALMALMCFHASRFDARVDEQGAYIRYDEQETALWNEELIEKGNEYFSIAAQDRALSRYHLEAAIAYWHTKKDDSKEKWEAILLLYNRLLQLTYSPLAALNRTYALAKAKGKKVGIEEAEKLQLKKSHFYHLLLGHLYPGIDDQKAMYHLQMALKLAKTVYEKSRIGQDISKFSERGLS